MKQKSKYIHQENIVLSRYVMKSF